jgi:hypothetical protein
MKLSLRSPCPLADFRLEPHERIKFCELCGKNVTNLSAMTEAEARRFLKTRDRTTQGCVSFRQDSSGNIRFVTVAALSLLAACEPDKRCDAGQAPVEKAMVPLEEVLEAVAVEPAPPVPSIPEPPAAPSEPPASNPDDFMVMGLL